MRKRQLLSLVVILVSILALQIWSGRASASQFPSVYDTFDPWPARKQNVSHVGDDLATVRL